jgi:hypothetical protein
MAAGTSDQGFRCPLSTQTSARARGHTVATIWPQLHMFLVGSRWAVLPVQRVFRALTRGVGVITGIAAGRARSAGAPPTPVPKGGQERQAAERPPASRR